MRSRSAGSQLPAGEITTVQIKDHTLDDDDGSVDEDAEVDGPQAHQVGPHPEEVHHDKGKKKGQRNGRCHHKTTAEVAQKDHQHEDHDECPQRQVLSNRRGRTFDQTAAVQKRSDLHARRKGFLDQGHPVLHSFDDIVGVLTFEHHHNAPDRFPLTVLGEGAVPEEAAEPDVSDISDKDRDARHGWPPGCCGCRRAIA